MPLRLLLASGAEVEVSSKADDVVRELRLELSGTLGVSPQALELVAAGHMLKDEELVPDADVFVIVSKFRHELILNWNESDSETRIGNVGELALGPGNNAHSIAALITWPAEQFFPRTRSWMLSLGSGQGSHHWLWNPSREPPFHQAAQFGVFCGDQVERELHAVPETRARIVVTFDGDMLILYVDGKVHDAIRDVAFGFNGTRQQVCLGEAPMHGESHFPGVFHEVTVWSRALPLDEVLAFTAGSAAVLPASRFHWQNERSQVTPGVVGNIELGPGNSQHSIAAFISWPEERQFPRMRSWLLLLGETGPGTHHWLWYPRARYGAHGSQLGVFNGEQALRDLPAVPEARTCVVVTFDGDTLIVYLDGKVHEVVHGVRFAFNGTLQELNLAEAKFAGDSHFPGVIHAVTVWGRALLPEEVIGYVQEGNGVMCPA